jgi:hypothetical protein
MTDDEGLEERIRTGLAGRDPGPAPAWLRVRVAAVSTEPQPGHTRIRRWTAVARFPVAATLTMAAALFGVLLVSLLRSAVLRPAGPGSTTGPGSTRLAPDLATVGDPLALPIGWTIFFALVGLLVAWAAVEVYLGTPGAQIVDLGRLRGKRARGVVVALLAAPILIFGQVVQRDTSIVQGRFFQASLVHLQGMGTQQGPTLQAEPVASFRYVPGGTVTFVQSVRNAGQFPITVTGSRPGSAEVELRLFAVHDASASIDVDATPTYPFAPIALAPGQEREIIAVVHFAPCPGIPVPTLEPSPDLSGYYVPPDLSATAIAEIDTLGLTYSVLGFEREVDLPLFSSVVVRSPTGSMCGTDPDWATPSPAAP